MRCILGPPKFRETLGLASAQAKCGSELGPPVHLTYRRIRLHPSATCPIDVDFRMYTRYAARNRSHWTRLRISGQSLTSNFNHCARETATNMAPKGSDSVKPRNDDPITAEEITGVEKPSDTSLSTPVPQKRPNACTPSSSTAPT